MVKDEMLAEGTPAKNEKLHPLENALNRAYGMVKDEMLAEGTPAKNEKLHPPFVDQLTVPDGASESDDCILNCIMKQLGINYD